jgi:hypothetical protein
MGTFLVEFGCFKIISLLAFCPTAVDKTELSDIFLNNVHGNPEEKLKLQERYEQIENDYQMGNKRATEGIDKCVCFKLFKYYNFTN